jgi:hypothetical protein
VTCPYLKLEMWKFFYPRFSCERSKYRLKLVFLGKIGKAGETKRGTERFLFGASLIVRLD